MTAPARHDADSRMTDAQIANALAAVFARGMDRIHERFVARLELLEQRTAGELSQPAYDAAMRDIEAAYPGINDDGTCVHGLRYDQCPICVSPAPEDTAP